MVLPDYQGLGLALRLMELVGSWARAIGYRLMTHPAHPALVQAQARSERWKMRQAPQFASQHTLPQFKKTVTTNRRKTAAFEYVGPRCKDEREARRMWGDDTLNREGIHT